MKKNKPTKIIISLGMMVMALAYFGFKTNLGGDARLTVQAAHTCADAGGLDCGYCTTGYTCYSDNNLTCYCKAMTCANIGAPYICNSFSCGYGSCSAEGQYACACPLTLTPTPSLVPTAIPHCDAVLNECDPAWGQECISHCRTDYVCPTGYQEYSTPKYKVGDCFSNVVDCRHYSPAPIGPCRQYNDLPGIPDSSCGWCLATGLSVTPALTATPFCQPLYSNTVSWPTTDCPAFYPATTCAAEGGIGCCDNCHGMSCGACGGGSGPESTPVPGCTPDCSTDPCRDTICSDQTCLGVCGAYCYGALSCIPPQFSSLIIKNASATVVSADAQSRNHICESAFYDNASPRQVVFDANVGDPDGYADISLVELCWNGVGYTMAYVSGSGIGALYRATVDFSSGQNDSGTYPLEVRVTDSKALTTGWVASGRSWKVWDCRVEVGGSIYDGSGGQACNMTGFANLVDSGIVTVQVS